MASRSWDRLQQQLAAVAQSLQGGRAGVTQVVNRFSRALPPFLLDTDALRRGGTQPTPAQLDGLLRYAGLLANESGGGHCR